MSRGQQIIRQWRLLRAIESSRLGRTAVDLHREVRDLGSLRTIYRDLDDLQGAGFPLYQDNGGCWRLLSPSEGGPSVPIRPTEMMALILSEQILEPLRGSELAEPLLSLRSKLEAMLGPKTRAYVEKLRGGLLATVAAPGSYSGLHEELETIKRAILERRRLRLVHFSAQRGRTLSRTIDPYGIWYLDGALYLIAFDHLREDYRKFLVDRIRGATLLEETFHPDPDFDLHAYVGRGFRVWHGAVHRIVIEFRPSLAHLPHERRYHRTQKVLDLPSGGCRVTFDAAGLPEIASWVASFGGMAQAVEPPELVEMVKDLHRRGLQAYGGGVEPEQAGLSSRDMSPGDTGKVEAREGCFGDGPERKAIKRRCTVYPRKISCTRLIIPAAAPCRR